MAAGVEGIARGGRDWARFAADRLIGKLRKRIAALEQQVQRQSLQAQPALPPAEHRDEVELRIQAIRPCLCQLVAGKTPSGYARAARNIGAHNCHGCGADALRCQLLHPQRSQRGRRRGDVNGSVAPSTTVRFRCPKGSVQPSYIGKGSATQCDVDTNIEERMTMVLSAVAPSTTVRFRCPEVSFQPSYIGNGSVTQGDVAICIGERMTKVLSAFEPSTTVRFRCPEVSLELSYFDKGSATRCDVDFCAGERMTKVLSACAPSTTVSFRCPQGPFQPSYMGMGSVTQGDVEICFGERRTKVLAAFEPSTTVRFRCPELSLQPSYAGKGSATQCDVDTRIVERMTMLGSENEHLSIANSGIVDSGECTTAGRVIFELGRTVAIVKRWRRFHPERVRTVAIVKRWRSSQRSV